MPVDVGFGEAGIDRRGEARIVELDREIVAAFAARLLPRRAEGDIPATRRWLEALSLPPIPAGTMRDVRGLDAARHDRALILRPFRDGRIRIPYAGKTAARA